MDKEKCQKLVEMLELQPINFGTVKVIHKKLTKCFHELHIIYDDLNSDPKLLYITLKYDGYEDYWYIQLVPKGLRVKPWHFRKIKNLDTFFNHTSGLVSNVIGGYLREETSSSRFREIVEPIIKQIEFTIGETDITTGKCEPIDAFDINGSTDAGFFDFNFNGSNYRLKYDGNCYMLDDLAQPMGFASSVIHKYSTIEEVMSKILHDHGMELESQVLFN